MPLVLSPAGTAPSGALRWDWLDPTGVLRDLTFATSPNLFVSRGTAGLGSPSVEPRTEKLPTSPGSVLRYLATGPLEIDLPIHTQAASMGALLITMATLREWFDTGNERLRAPGHLRITRPSDDAVRQIACYYTGGLEGDLSEGGPLHTSVVLSLLAPDPYWTDITETVTTYDQADLGVSQAVINSGDFDAYPVWTIDGPLINPTIANATTGKSFAFTQQGGLNLAVGDILTVDTRPASQRPGYQAQDADGLNFFDRIAAGGAFWHLVPGVNSFVITGVGATVDTAITLSWLPRYRGILR